MNSFATFKSNLLKISWAVPQKIPLIIPYGIPLVTTFEIILGTLLRIKKKQNINSWRYTKGTFQRKFPKAIMKNSQWISKSIAESILKVFPKELPNKFRRNSRRNSLKISQNTCPKK